MSAFYCIFFCFALAPFLHLFLLCVSCLSIGPSVCFCLGFLVFVSSSLWVVPLFLSAFLCHSCLSDSISLTVFLSPHCFYLHMSVFLGLSLFSLHFSVSVSPLSFSQCLRLFVYVWLSLSFSVFPSVPLSISIFWSLPHRLPVTPMWLWPGPATWY